MSEKLDLDALERRIAACDLAAVDAYDAIGYLIARIRELERDKADWLKANAPGGWIDDLRRASQPGSGEDDTARLDFMIEQQCWIQWTNRDGSILQCQVYTQDEDEEYHVHPSEDRYFNTPREALDAARASLDGPTEGQLA